MRTARRVIVVLLLGAIVNVAVAWWGMTLEGPSDWSEIPPDRLARLWKSLDRSIPSGSFLTGSGVHMRGTSVIVTLAVAPENVSPTFEDLITYPDAPPNHHSCLVFEAGRPLRSLRGHYVRRSPDTNRASDARRGIAELPENVWNLPLPGLNLGASRKLPYYTIWPGFIANTLLYALPFAVLMLLYGPLRRRLRLRRGVCPNCRYDLRGSIAGEIARCPECGETTAAALLSVVAGATLASNECWSWPFDEDRLP